MDYMTNKESPQREQLNHTPFVEQIKNIVNNLPIMKYMVLQQTKYAIWAKKGSNEWHKAPAVRLKRGNISLGRRKERVSQL